MKIKLIFKIKCTVISMGAEKEYIYNAWLTVGNTTYFLENYYNAYAKSAASAKAQIKTQSQFCNVIDNLIDGRIIEKDGYPLARVID